MKKINVPWCFLKRLYNNFPINDKLYNLTPEQIQLRNTVFEFASKELSPFAYDIDKNNVFPNFKDFFKKLGHLGLLGVTAPNEYGGSDMGYLEHCIVMEEISRSSASIGLSYGVQSNLSINQIVRNGNEQQKRKYLPKLISGDQIGALAMSEVGSGSDVFSMKTTAIEKGDHYVINGSKFWITNGPDADVLIIYARTPTVFQSEHLKPLKPVQKHKNITAFLVEKGTKGFSVSPKLDKMGMRGSNTCELVFENCIVPKENVLGKVNGGDKVLMSGLDYERLILAAGPVGIMQACCDVAFKYCHERKAFDQPIGTFQIMQAKMADMYMDLVSSRSYLYSVASAIDRGENLPMDCTATIYLTSSKATKVALDAIQCLGGNGYINDYPTGRFLRDAKLYEIGAGTNEIRQLVIGRAINSMYGIKGH